MIDFRAAFKACVDAKDVSSVDMVQYAILRAMAMKTPQTLEDRINIASTLVRRHFRSVKNRKMLDNGVDPDRAVRAATEITKRARIICGILEKHMFDDERERVMYKNIAVALYEQFKIPADLYTRQYVYIFVRQDLSPEYQLVQAAHAAAKMGHRSSALAQDKFDELYFSVIGVPDLTAMARALEDFKQRGIKTYPFIEPDIGNVMTSFASYPVWAGDRKGLLAYKRLVFAKPQ
jgi:hypothetical protein